MTENDVSCEVEGDSVNTHLRPSMEILCLFLREKSSWTHF